ncbi:MAG TPA: hypothetical protein VMB05_13555 [Solirubrobacteraceae bacterium]|nr:hypothetical protein [Solirubrobacteraceae bacterium]
MRMRYLANLALAAVAVCLVVFTQAFAAATVVWLTFALAIALTVIAVPMLGMRPTAQRAIGAIAALIAIYTIPASLVFASATVVWVGFSTGVALAALGAAGLTLHEYTTERVVHALEVAAPPVSVNGQSHAGADRERELVSS